MIKMIMFNGALHKLKTLRKHFKLVYTIYYDKIK